MFEKKNLLATAEAYVRDNKIKKGIDTYLKAYDKDHDVHILTIVGDLYVKLGDLEKATGFFMRAAGHYLECDRREEAISSYLKAHNTDPKDLKTIMTLAELYIKANSKANAVKFLQKVCKICLEKTNLDLEDSTRIQKVIKLNQKVLAADADNVDLLISQAELYRKIGKIDQTITLLMQVGTKLVQEGKLERSLELLTSLLRENACDVALVDLATDILNKLGRPSEALPFQKRFLEKEPSNTHMLRLLATTLTALGDYGQAEEIFRKLVRLDSKFQSDFLKFNYFLVSCDKIDRAVECVRELMTRSNYSEKTEMVYLLKKILEKQPHHVLTLNTLAELYSQCGDSVQMLKTYHQLFDLHFKNKQLDEAAEMAKRLLELNYKDEKFLTRYEKLVIEMTGGGPDQGPMPHGVPPSGSAGEPEVGAEKQSLQFGLKVDWEKQTSNEPGQELLSNIDILCRYGHFETAIDVLKSNLATNPGSATLHEKLKSIYVSQKLLTHAARECIELFKIYQSKGDQSSADASLKEALKLDPALSPRMLEAGKKEVALGLIGDFETFTIPDIIQFIENSGKSGILKIVSSDEEGRLYFNGGQVVDAEIGKRQGIEAVYHLIRITKGSYEFEPREAKFPVRIRVSTINLLLEGLRLLDEERARNQTQDTTH